MEIVQLNLYLFIHPLMALFTLKLLFLDNTKKEALVSFIIVVLWFSIWYFFFPFPNLYEHELNLPKMSIFLDMDLRKLQFLGYAESALILNCLCARKITNHAWVNSCIHFVYYKLIVRKIFLSWALFRIIVLFLKLNLFYFKTGTFYTAPYIITFFVLLLTVYTVHDHFYNKPKEIHEYINQEIIKDHEERKFVNFFVFLYLCSMIK